MVNGFWFWFAFGILLHGGLFPCYVLTEGPAMKVFHVGPDSLFQPKLVPVRERHRALYGGRVRPHFDVISVPIGQEGGRLSTARFVLYRSSFALS